MDRSRFILQDGRRIVTAADNAAHPLARVDRCQHSFVHLGLQLQVHGGGSSVRVRGAELCPVQASSFSVYETAIGRAIDRGISHSDDDRFADERGQR